MHSLVVVIINLNAMLIRKKGLKYINKIKKIAERYDNVKVFITQSSNQVRSIIRKSKKSNAKFICCCGGDGAVRLIAQEAIKIYKSEDIPIIVPIGGGSMSMIAKALGFTKEPHQNLETVLKLRAEINQPVYPAPFPKNPQLATKIKEKKQILPTKPNNPAKRCGIYLKELVKIDDAGKIYYGFFFTIGVVVDCLKYYEKTSKGLWAAICLIFHCILGTVISKFKIYHYAQAKAIYDGHEFSKNRFAGIIAANIKNVVLTFRPLSGTIQKGSFLLGIYALNAYDLLSHVFKYLWGKPVFRDLKAGRVVNGNAKELTLETDEDMSIDGDVFLNRSHKTRIIKITTGPTIPMLNLRQNSTGI